MEKKSINAVGVMFFSKNTKRVLYMLRKQKEQTWGLPGGKIEENESLKDALMRECTEEIGFWPRWSKLIPIDCYHSNDNRFVYHTFFCLVPNEFVPILNDEHIAYCWSNLDVYPKPLHSGLYSTLQYPIIQQKITMILDSI
jgi:ADP-ribose pyrophosphatase YjhB (NUDIX family)